MPVIKKTKAQELIDSGRWVYSDYRQLDAPIAFSVELDCYVEPFYNGNNIYLKYPNGRLVHMAHVNVLVPPLRDYTDLGKKIEEKPSDSRGKLRGFVSVARRIFQTYLH